MITEFDPASVLHHPFDLLGVGDVAQGIGAHNHEVAVLEDPALAAAGYRVSHRDLNDGTVEGLVHASGRIASVQFHPEGAPGPIDAARVFDLATAGALADRRGAFLITPA